MRPVDYSVYLVTDRTICGGASLEDTVRKAVAGGVTIVQLREKHTDTREFVELARGLKQHLVALNIPLIINDRVDVALASGADGVHVGQSDMACADVRSLIGPDAILGLSVETVGQAEEALALDVDYLGISPVFATPTKTDTGEPWGLEGMTRLKSMTSLPLVGIGGIGVHNAADVIAAGAAGVAVVSAICGQPQPEAAARNLLGVVKAAG